MNLKARIEEILQGEEPISTKYEVAMLSLLNELAKSEKEHILILRFATEEDMDAFTGQLSDGFGEEYVDITLKQCQDGTFDWSHCSIDMTPLYTDYMDDDDYDEED